MTSPLSRISTGSFFSGVMREYSSFCVAGATVTDVSAILSISPSSIAAMRTLRAKGEAGEKVSFIGNGPLSAQGARHGELVILRNVIPGRCVSIELRCAVAHLRISRFPDAQLRTRGLVL